MADYGVDIRINRLIGCLYDAWCVVANRYGTEPHNNWHGMITMTDRWSRVKAHGVGREQVLYYEIPLSGCGGLARGLRRFLVFWPFFYLAMGFALGELRQLLRRSLRRRKSAG